MKCFDFISIATRYNKRIALQIGSVKYSYKQLAREVQSLAGKYKNTPQIVSLTKLEPLEFIKHFLAIHIAKKIPLIGANNFKSNKTIPQNLLFLGVTSGTTGMPKIYQRNWESWRLGFDACAKKFHLTKYDVIATSSPLTTSLGLHTLLLTFYLGKTFTLSQDLSTLSQFQGKIGLFSVPSFVALHLSELVTSDCSALFCGGGQLNNKLVLQIRKLINIPIFEFYGSSETSFIAYQNVTKSKKLDCVGSLFPGVVLLENTSKKVQVKSPYLFNGYIGMKPPETWETDDVGYLKNKELYLFCRRSEMIDQGGNKINPIEIERLASDLCMNCVVFGVFDKIYGQKIAILVKTPSNVALFKEKLEQRLPKYKRPKIYLLTDEIPLTKNHKISRMEMADRYEEGSWNEF